MEASFRIHIITLNEGLKTIEDVRIIRIKSKDYNLLIMKDYVPIIGSIEGDIEIEAENENYALKNIIAYYINSENKFNLIVKEQKNG